MAREAEEQLKQGTLTGLHLVYMKKDILRAILATENDVNQLPNQHDSMIHSGTPIEVELSENALGEY